MKYLEDPRRGEAEYHSHLAAGQEQDPRLREEQYHLRLAARQEQDMQFLE